MIFCCCRAFFCGEMHKNALHQNENSFLFCFTIIARTLWPQTDTFFSGNPGELSRQHLMNAYCALGKSLSLNKRKYRMLCAVKTNKNCSTHSLCSLWWSVIGRWKFSRKNFFFLFLCCCTIWEHSFACFESRKWNFISLHDHYCRRIIIASIQTAA